MDSPVTGGLGGTYTGNPVACAAALASLEEMASHDLAGRAKEIETIIREVLEPLVDDTPVAEVRGRGAMIAIELLDAAGSPAADLTAKVAAHCKEQGVLILTCGMDGNVIRLFPPLVISEDLLRAGLGVLADSIRTNA